MFAAFKGLTFRPIRAGLTIVLAAGMAAGAWTSNAATSATQGMRLILGNGANAPRVLSVKGDSGITTTLVNNKVTTITYGRGVTDRSRDPLGVYSGRPLMAVGDIKSVDPTSRTVVLTIDPALSQLPPSLEAKAKRRGVLEKLKAREFPPERLFFITRSTSLIDPALLEKNPPLKTATLREVRARETIALEDFHPGDRVSIYFRYKQDPGEPAGVINMIKQDRNRTDYSAIYRPAPIQHRIIDSRQITTETLARHKQLRNAGPKRRNGGAIERQFTTSGGGQPVPAKR